MSNTQIETRHVMIEAITNYIVYVRNKCVKQLSTVLLVNKTGMQDRLKSIEVATNYSTNNFGETRHVMMDV